MFLEVSHVEECPASGCPCVSSDNDVNNRQRVARGSGPEKHCCQHFNNDKHPLRMCVHERGRGMEDTTEGQNQVRATSTPTQRTTTPDGRPFTAHTDMNESNTSFKSAFTQSARCRPRPSCPRCFPLAVVEVGLLPFLDVQRANPSRQGLGHQSSCTWVIQLLACSPQLDRVVERYFMWFLSWVTILRTSFFQTFWRPPPESGKLLRQNSAADRSHSQHPVEYGAKCAKRFVFGRVSFRTLQSVGAYFCCRMFSRSAGCLRCSYSAGCRVVLPHVLQGVF